MIRSCVEASVRMFDLDHGTLRRGKYVQKAKHRLELQVAFTFDEDSLTNFQRIHPPRYELISTLGVDKSMPRKTASIFFNSLVCVASVTPSSGFATECCLLTGIEVLL